MRFLLVCLLLAMGACSDAPVGSADRPFRMYFVPSVDAEGLTQRSAELKQAVERFVSQKLYGSDSGFHVETAIPASYITVVEALGTKRADFAAFNTFAYVLARDVKGYDVEPLFTVARGMFSEESTYCGQIIARADSGIESLEDLAGRKFAYVDPASTSGFVLPRSLLKERGVELGDEVFAQKHDNVVTMVYQGQVDAGATYFSPPAKLEEDGKVVWAIRDARMRVLTQFPDVEEKVKIVAFTEEVPNEPWVIRGNLYEDRDLNARVKQYVKEALQEFAHTEAGKKALWTVATGTGLVPATPETYEKIRDMILDSNMDLAAALAEKG
ncbi:MAG: phosphate/phosphite/phosphonate ABC transporter substrate-binding protein [Planctomycetota bacterium]|jgi:phosphonate transport system substrate-binding protein